MTRAKKKATTRGHQRATVQARTVPVAQLPARPIPVSRARSRRNWWILAIAIIALLVLFGSYAAKNAYEQWRVLGTATTGVRYTVTTESRIGFALGTGDLAFGKIVPGGGGTRTATLAAAESAIAVIHVPSDLEGLLLVYPNPIALDTGVPVNVTFDLTVPIGTPIGDYTSEIAIVYLRRLPWE